MPRMPKSHPLYALTRHLELRRAQDEAESAAIAAKKAAQVPPLEIFMQRRRAEKATASQSTKASAVRKPHKKKVAVVPKAALATQQAAPETAQPGKAKARRLKTRVRIGNLPFSERVKARRKAAAKAPVQPTIPVAKAARLRDLRR